MLHSASGPASLAGHLRPLPYPLLLDSPPTTGFSRIDFQLLTICETSTSMRTLTYAGQRNKSRLPVWNRNSATWIKRLNWWLGFDHPRPQDWLCVVDPDTGDHCRGNQRSQDKERIHRLRRR